MGRTERKLKKKTRLERQQIYIDRLGQFNTNAMHEVGKLAMGLRHYAAGESWEGHECTVQDPKSPEKYVVWKGEFDGPELARKVLTALGLPWDLVPTEDPTQPGRETITKSLATEMRKDAEDRAPDDRSEYGTYGEEGKIIPIDVNKQHEGEPPKGVPPAENSRGE